MVFGTLPFCKLVNCLVSTAHSSNEEEGGRLLQVRPISLSPVCSYVLYVLGSFLDANLLLVLAFACVVALICSFENLGERTLFDSVRMLDV